MNKHFRIPGQFGRKLEELEIPVPAVLRRAGLAHNLFQQPRVLVTTEELFALWRAIGQVVPDRVRTAIQERLTGHRPTIDDVSRDLHLSARTLQRRLRDAGASYQQLLDEARHRMARYYLGNSVLELNEAAYLLGYEDANSFVRAF